MILYQGQVLPDDKQFSLIASLKGEILKTLQEETYPTVEEVIKACSVLYQKVIDHQYDTLIMPVLRSLNLPYETLLHYATPFSEEGLRKKVTIELGDLANGPLSLDEHTIREREPLGVLFHIAAGNVDLLPAYSIIEGLLAGNINILKLPTGDNGLSIKLLSELIAVDPHLAPFIYVFDVPSTEIETIKTMSSYADATIVWGGEAVAKAAREFVDIHSKLIIWGHKISFSYVDSNVSNEELTTLAHSICFSNGLFCSSTQGIYLDTSSMGEALAFGKRFLKILDSVSQKDGGAPLTMRAKNALNLYNDKLENKIGTILAKDGVSVRVLPDSKLELSYLFRDIWVKPLPHNKIIETLKGNKNLLQTASVSIKPSHYLEIASLLAKAGISRIVRLGDNSRMIAGESHDGEYPLQLYSRIVERYKLENNKNNI